MSEDNVVKPEHLLEVASISAYKVLKKFHILRRYYADEVESESLLAATMAAKYYPTRGLLFTWGLLYAQQAIVDAMRRQKWLPEFGSMVVQPWDVVSESFEDSHGACVPLDINESDAVKARLALVLKPREADMLWRHIVMEETFKSIGDLYNVTRQAVQQTVNKSKEHLRRAWAS